MISSGLRNRVMLQARASGQDGVGQPSTGWVDVRPLWADVRHKSGLATIKADAPVSVVKASIRIRPRSDVVAGMRITYKGLAYEIKAVVPDLVGRKHLDLVCEVVS